jgi:hypothetical protein
MGATLANALHHPAIARLVAINLLFTLAFTAMEAIFPLFSQRAFGWTAQQNGYIFTYVGRAWVVWGASSGRWLQAVSLRLAQASLSLLALA